MLIRERRSQVVPGQINAFNAFFLKRLFPVQVRHGAILKGR